MPNKKEVKGKTEVEVCCDAARHDDAETPTRPNRDCGESAQEHQNVTNIRHVPKGLVAQNG